MTRIRVLGELAVVRGSGDVVTLPRGLPRQLLGFLALHRRSVSRREVVAHLWPDADEESGLRRLRTALWEVQRVLVDDAAPVVDSARTTLSLHPWVAVDLNEAEALLQSGAAEAALRLLEPGLTVELDQEWASPSRRRAEALLVDALTRLVSESADPHTAVGYARRRVDVDGLSEPAHQDLVRCLARAGDRSAAFAAYAQMRDVLHRELGTAPSAQSRRLLAQLASGETPPADRHNPSPQLPRGRVPLSPTAMLGRDRELTEVLSALRDSRLVTIVGIGGMGKSRLAIAVAERLRHDGPVTFVELAATSEPETCAYVVAAQLGVVAGQGRSIIEAIAEFLAAEPGLLVLDNCEHVRETLAELVTAVTTRSDATRILATSRERLAAPGEQIVPLAPLAVPQADESEEKTLTCASVRLLIDAAARRGASPEALKDVAALRGLARRLDGIPLALELAGGRLTTFEAAALTETLQRGLSLLSAARTTSRNGPDRTLDRSGRHDSLVRTFDWSLSTLAPVDRRLLGLMATCRGELPFRLVKALGGSTSLASDPAAALARLVEAGLVRAQPKPRWSYSMLEPVRLHAEEKLNPADRAVAETALLEWATSFSGETKRLLYADEAGASVDLDHYFPLIRQAVYTARARRDPDAERRIVTQVEPWSVWRERTEVWHWVLELATAPNRPPADSQLCKIAALACFRQGRMDEMRDFTKRCIDLDTDGLYASEARTQLAWSERRWADVAETVDGNGESAVADRAVNLSLRSGAQAHLGHVDAAINLAREARSYADESGMPTMRAISMLALGRAYARRHQKTQEGPDPEPILAEGRHLAASVGSSEIEAGLCQELGRHALVTGRAAEAVEPSIFACRYWLVAGNRRYAEVVARQLVEALLKIGRTRAASALKQSLDEDQLTHRRFHEAMSIAEAPD